MIKGAEFHNIIENIFDDVRGINFSEQLQVCCPRCQERDGLSHPDGKYNLEINTAKRVFRCWKCDEPKFSGSLGKLIRIFGTNVEYEMYKALAGSFSNYDYESEEDESVIVSLPFEMILFSQMDITNPEHFEAYNYMVVERKIKKEIIFKYRIGFCVEGKYAGRIIIPSYDENGDINYFVARSFTKQHKKPYDNPKSNKSNIIFNEGYVNWDSLVFIVEGVFEMLSLPNSIPILGKTISTTLYEKLKFWKPQLIIALDPDAWQAEMKLYDTLKLIYNENADKIKVLNLKGNFDIDEVRRNKGNNTLIKSLYNARELNDNDYFEKKMENPYGKKQQGGYYSNSRYFKQ